MTNATCPAPEDGTILANWAAGNLKRNKSMFLIGERHISFAVSWKYVNHKREIQENE